MKNLISKEEKDRIDLICKEYNIKNYSISSDGSIDADGDVFLTRGKITQFPLKFGKVSGNFSCSYNQLTSLNGAPHTVDGIFNCNDNKLTTLEGGPHTVGDKFWVGYNHLTNLVGSPVTVGGDLICSHNNLTTLEGCSSTIGGDLICIHNKLISTYSGDVDIEVGGNFFPGDSFLKLTKSIADNTPHIKTILKYQRHFYIWNDDLTLNEENFKDLMAEIEDGLQ